MLIRAFLILLPVWPAVLICRADAAESSAGRWINRFKLAGPALEQDGVCSGNIGALTPFEVQPKAPGIQLVRASLPFAPGAFPCELTLRVHCGDTEIQPDVRILTQHPGRPASVRRAIITFPFDFSDANSHRFTLSLASPSGRSERKPEATAKGSWKVVLGDTAVFVGSDTVAVSFGKDRSWTARLIAPSVRPPEHVTPEVIEWGDYYCWARVLVPDDRWPRIIEVRMDAAGAVAVQAHVQRLEKGDAMAPDLGWEIKGPALSENKTHSFSQGDPCSIAALDATFTLSFPIAPENRRGHVEIANENGDSKVRYLRCTADEKVPFQESAWRRAEFVVSKGGGAQLNALLEPALNVRVPPDAFQAAYRLGPTPDLGPWPILEELRKYTDTAIVESMLCGDDFGNVTSFSDSAPAAVFGMNRLNHCPAIFEEAWRTGYAPLRDTAVHWCNNMYDLSTWWADADEFGGTRYNNANAAGSKEHLDNKNFMWRMNNAVHFCTKGFDSYLYAYEETGDPRMAVALKAQAAYSAKYVHADQGECRNIGDAGDLMHLYKETGLAAYREEALRLFRELRTKLSAGDLFSQGGQPIVEHEPFIDDDQRGYKFPFAKPYIIGYALAGLPELMRVCPDEPKLRDVIRAVADFMASSQDPVGGWRYPHPRSSGMILNQALEHAAQLSRAASALEARGEPIAGLLDAIERVLQQRVNCFARTGKILSGLQGWERNSGNLKEGQTLYDLYKKPDDRDAARDYTEGEIGIGGAPPEGLVYFTEVLTFYLAHRPADRLFNANEPLRTVLARTEARQPPPVSVAAASEPERFGVRDELPRFRDAQVARMSFPLSWTQAGLPFDAWRKRAREALFNCMPPRPPLTPFSPAVVAVENRGRYEARKLILSLSQDARVIAYLLVPKGNGPFPAMLALHDHGAHFSIGKEKVIRPFAESQERIEDAEKWVKECYGGKYIGDELAARGYVVFSADALFWGDRGRSEGVKYDAQQALAANLFQLGLSWAGLILWDDIRSAEFLQSLPGVDPDRIGSIGLSMGCFRMWSLAAATDIIKAGVAICWMGDTPTLTSPGNNQTKGQSAYSMIHANLRNSLDYPDVASIACPKPMLFFNGEKDGLFPVPGVEACYEKLHRVWRDRGVEDRLVTKLWPVPHEFNREMQAEAFAWLDRQLKPR